MATSLVGADRSDRSTTDHAAHVGLVWSASAGFAGYPELPTEGRPEGQRRARHLRHPYLPCRRQSPGRFAGDQRARRNDSCNRGAQRRRTPRRSGTNPPRPFTDSSAVPNGWARVSVRHTADAPAVQLTAGGVPKLALSNPYFGDLEVPATTIALQLQVPFAGTAITPVPHSRSRPECGISCTPSARSAGARSIS